METTIKQEGGRMTLAGGGGPTTVNPAPDWPALWALEPGLRPDRLRSLPQEQWELEVAYPLSDVRLPSEPVGSAIAAALCRDAAVRWLAKEAGERGLEIERDYGSDGVRICFDLGAERYDNLGVGPTLDHALHAACLAVIRAKGRQ